MFILLWLYLVVNLTSLPFTTTSKSTMNKTGSWGMHPPPAHFPSTTKMGPNEPLDMYFPFFSSFFKNLLTNFKLGYNYHHHNWMRMRTQKGLETQVGIYFYFCLVLMITNGLRVRLPSKHPTAVNGHEQGWVHEDRDGTWMNTQMREFDTCTDACRALSIFFNFNFYSTNDYLHIAHTERAPSPLATSVAHQDLSTTTLQQWRPLGHPSHPL